MEILQLIGQLLMDAFTGLYMVGATLLGAIASPILLPIRLIMDYFHL